MTTRAVRDGAHWVLDGCKTWISNGGIADFYCVFARTGAGTAGARGISAFVVPADARGLAVAERIAVMAPHPLARIEFAGCRVGADALVGAEGDGFKLAMRTLDIFRASVAAAAVGFARRALDEAQSRARDRRMFGGVLADRELAQATLGDMATDVDAAALLTYRAAWLRDVRRVRTTNEAAMAKLAATESAQRVIDAAVQMHGGAGRHARGDRRAALSRHPRAAHLRRRDRRAAADRRARVLAERGRPAHDDVRPLRHVRARPPAAARRMARVRVRAARAALSRRAQLRDELLDGAVARGWGERTAILAPGGRRWTYAELLAQANRIARVLTEDFGSFPATACCCAARTAR